MSSLFNLSLNQSASPEDGRAFVESALGAMVQMMRVKPTLCPVRSLCPLPSPGDACVRIVFTANDHEQELSFRGLLELGSHVAPRVSKRERSHSRRAWDAEAVTFQLFEELARLTLG